MTRLVSGVITTARDRHPAFDRHRHPDALLYRFVADYAQEVQGKILAIDPTVTGIETTVQFALPLASFPAGMPLGANRIVTSVSIFDRTVPVAREFPIDLISRDQKFHRNGPAAAAWQEGDVLYLRSPANQWASYGGVTVKMQEPFGDADVVALQARGALVPLPDEASLMVTEALANLMARRGHMDAALPPINEGSFATALARAEQAFYAAIANRQVGRRFFTADVWPE